MILKFICYIFGTKMTIYLLFWNNSDCFIATDYSQNFASMIHQGLPLTRPKEIDIEKSHFLIGGSRVIRGISVRG